MARHLDWEKANRDEKQKRNRPTGSQRKKKLRHDRQVALLAFVEKHDLKCFKCGSELAEWAKTGFSKRGPWAICVSCVNKR